MNISIDKNPKNKNSGVEKYNNWNENFAKGIQRQSWVGRRKNSELDDRTVEIIESEERKKIEEKIIYLAMN